MTRPEAADCCVCDDMGPCEFCPHVARCDHSHRREDGRGPGFEGREFCGDCGVELTPAPVELPPVFIAAGWFE